MWEVAGCTTSCRSKSSGRIVGGDGSPAAVYGTNAALYARTGVAFEQAVTAYNELHEDINRAAVGSPASICCACDHF